MLTKCKIVDKIYITFFIKTVPNVCGFKERKKFYIS